MKEKNINKSFGFSLFDMLFVIAVIGIIAIVALPRMRLVDDEGRALPKTFNDAMRVTIVEMHTDTYESETRPVTVQPRVVGSYHVVLDVRAIDVDVAINSTAGIKGYEGFVFKVETYGYPWDGVENFWVFDTEDAVAGEWEKGKPIVVKSGTTRRISVKVDLTPLKLASGAYALTLEKINFGETVDDPRAFFHTLPEEMDRTTNAVVLQ